MDKNYNLITEEDGTKRLEIFFDYQDEEGKEYKEEIKEYSTAEIFCRENIKPFIGIGKTGTGKSFFSVDLINSALKSFFNFPFFFTSTISSPENAYLRDFLPNEFIHNFDISFIASAFSYLTNYNDIITSSNSAGIINGLIQKYNLITPIENEYINKLKNIYESKMIQLIEAEDLKELTNGLSKEEIEYIRALKKNKKDLLKYLLNYDLEKIIFNIKAQPFRQFIQKLKDFRNKENELLLTFHKCVLFRNREKLEDNESDIINYFSAERCKGLFVFDDVTANLKSLDSDKNKKSYKNYADNGKITTDKGAIIAQDVLNNIFNTGRHLGLFIFLVHSIDTFKPDIIRLVSNIIFFSESSVNSCLEFKGQSPYKRYKDRIRKAQDILTEVNNKFQTYYKLIFFSDASDSPDKKSNFAVFRSSKIDKKINENEYNINIQTLYKMLKGSAFIEKEESNNSDDLISDIEAYYDEEDAEDEEDEEENNEEDEEDEEIFNISDSVNASSNLLD